MRFVITVTHSVRRGRRREDSDVEDRQARWILSENVFVTMNIEVIREYCLSFPLATEDCAFGPDCLLFRIYGKIFACIDLTRPDRIVTKCDAERAEALRERYSGVIPAWHWNKRYWNELIFEADVPDVLVLQCVDHSVDEVLKKLPRRTQAEYAALRNALKGSADE